MAYRRKLDVGPSKVSLVEEQIRLKDDFITQKQLGSLLEGKANGNQISAALHLLKRYKAIDSMESDGQLWFYGTPESDTRTKTIETRVIEEPGTRAKRAYKRRT